MNDYKFGVNALAVSNNFLDFDKWTIPGEVLWSSDSGVMRI